MLKFFYSNKADSSESSVNTVQPKSPEKTRVRIPLSTRLIKQEKVADVLASQFTNMFNILKEKVDLSVKPYSTCFGESFKPVSSVWIDEKWPTEKGRFHWKINTKDRKINECFSFELTPYTKTIKGGKTEMAFNITVFYQEKIRETQKAPEAQRIFEFSLDFEISQHPKDKYNPFIYEIRYIPTSPLTIQKDPDVTQKHSPDGTPSTSTTKSVESKQVMLSPDDGNTKQKETVLAGTEFASPPEQLITTGKLSYSDAQKAEEKADKTTTKNPQAQQPRNNTTASAYGRFTYGYGRRVPEVEKTTTTDNTEQLSLNR